MDDSTKIIALLIICITLILFCPWLLMVLWNAVMPEIFGLTVINFKQAVILYWLSGLLFQRSINTKD